jgi:hypothetical protein
MNGERPQEVIGTDKVAKKRLLQLTAVMVVAALVLLIRANAMAESVPAMKVGVAASDVEVMQTQLLTGSSSNTVTLLSLVLHTTNPEDVQFGVTAECAVAWAGSITDTGSVQTQASAKLWVEVDGVRVQVSPSQGDDGKVAFCSRATELDAGIPGGFLSLYEKTKTANAFNWILGNVGSGTHTVVVYGQLDVFVNGIGYAEAGVGRRTLTAEPVHLTNDAYW